MKTKTAYLIRTGTAVDAANVSNKLRSYATSRRSVRAARRLGFPEAYAAKLTVAADAKLI